MSTEPESLVLQLLRDMRAEMADMRAENLTITEHDERLRRVERRLDPPPPETERPPA